MKERPFDTQEIKMEHKTQIEEIRRKYGHELSAHTFAALYLWQHHMELRLLLREDFFAVKCGMRGKNTWFFPCGEEEVRLSFIREKMSEPDFALCYLRAEDARWLNEHFPDQWELGREESADEYICNISEYIELKGSRFSEIRRKLRQIKSNYKTEARMLTDDNFQDAEVVFSRWEKAAHSVGEGELTDEGIAEMALKSRKDLDINGIVFYLNDVPAAVFAGFSINDTILDVLIGKCVPGTPRGTAYYGLHEYLKMCGKGYTECNHEEDLGIPGIRQMKKSLCPVRKNEIWEAVLK